MKPMLTFLLCVFITGTVACQPTATQLLQQSKSYYEGLANKVFLFTSRTKTVISTDTTTDVYTCTYQQLPGHRLLKIQSADGSYRMYDNDETYYINPARKEYLTNNRRENKSSERLKEMPYWRPDFLFKDLPRMFSDSKAIKQVTKVAAGYKLTLIDGSVIHVLKLDSSHRITLYKNVRVDPTYQTQVHESRFEEIDSTINYSLADELSQAKRSFTKLTGKEYDALPEPETLLGRVVNADSVFTLLGLRRPYPAHVLIDFFYKSCMPCIQSLPAMVELRNTLPDSTLAVIGVDPVLAEAGNWTAFKKRYSMNYPVKDGPAAEGLRKLLIDGVKHGYPTTLILSATGKFEYIHLGYQKNFTKMVTAVVVK